MYIYYFVLFRRDISDLRSFLQELNYWHFEQVRKREKQFKSNVNYISLYILKYPIYGTIKKELLLEWNPLFSISSEKYRYRRWLQQGGRRTERGVKKRSERKGDEDREEKSGSLESTLESTKCGAIGAVATCEPTSLERFTILAR